MTYEWKKPLLMMHPLTADTIEDPAFWDDIRDHVNILITSRMPPEDEVWLLPADDVQKLAHRLTDFAISELKDLILDFKEESK